MIEESCRTSENETRFLCCGRSCGSATAAAAAGGAAAPEPSCAERYKTKEALGEIVSRGDRCRLLCDRLHARARRGLQCRKHKQRSDHAIAKTARGFSEKHSASGFNRIRCPQWLARKPSSKFQHHRTNRKICTLDTSIATLGSSLARAKPPWLCSVPPCLC